MTSDNPAVAGRFVEESFSAKRHDATTIKNNTDDLSKPKVKIDELNAKVTEDGNALFDSNGRHIKSGHKFSHNANEELLESLKSIKKTVGETMELLEKARDKVASILPLKQGNALKRKSRKPKQGIATTTPRGDITAVKIWTKAGTGREKRLCQLGEDI